MRNVSPNRDFLGSIVGNAQVGRLFAILVIGGGQLFVLRKEVAINNATK